MNKAGILIIIVLLATFGIVIFGAIQTGYFEGMEVGAHTHPASDIVSGTFGNSRLDLSALAQNLVFTGAETVDTVDISELLLKTSKIADLGDIWTKATKIGNDGLDLSAIAQNFVSTHAIEGVTLDTGFGANELYDMDQNVLTTSDVVFGSIDTGQGANDLFDMDQNVLTSSSPSFSGLTLSGLSANRLVSTDGSKLLTSSDLVSWVTGTANEITVTDDLDGTITLDIPDSVTLVNLGVTDITIGGNTLDTNEWAFLDGLNQALKTSDAVTFLTVDTGEGANELFDMDQNVLTSSDVLFGKIKIGGVANPWHFYTSGGVGVDGNLIVESAYDEVAFYMDTDNNDISIFTLFKHDVPSGSPTQIFQVEDTGRIIMGGQQIVFGENLLQHYTTNWFELVTNWNYAGSQVSASYPSWLLSLHRGGSDVLDVWRHSAGGSWFQYLSISNTGQLQIPQQGSSAGLVIGGDTHIYRSASNQIGIGQGDLLKFYDEVGDKIALYSTSYGVGISSSDLATWSNGAFTWRDASRTGATFMELSSTGALTLDVIDDGLALVAGEDGTYSLPASYGEEISIVVQNKDDYATNLWLFNAYNNRAWAISMRDGASPALTYWYYSGSWNQRFIMYNDGGFDVHGDFRLGRVMSFDNPDGFGRAYIGGAVALSDGIYFWDGTNGGIVLTAGGWRNTNPSITDVSGVKSLDTTYQNTDGKTRVVYISLHPDNDGDWAYIFLDSISPPVKAIYFAQAPSTDGLTLSYMFLVPDDWYYLIDVNTGDSFTVETWFEGVL